MLWLFCRYERDGANQRRTKQRFFIFGFVLSIFHKKKKKKTFKKIEIPNFITWKWIQLTAVFSEWLMEPESYVYIQMVKNRSWGPSAWLWSATLRPHSRAPILPLCVLHTVTCIRYGNRIETLQPWKPLNFLFLYVHRVALTTDWANP